MKVAEYLLERRDLLRKTNESQCCQEGQYSLSNFLDAIKILWHLVLKSSLIFNIKLDFSTCAYAIKKIEFISWQVDLVS